MNNEKKDPWIGLGWKEEMIQLVDSNIPFNSSMECRASDAKQSHDDYMVTSFLQSIYIWK